MIRSDKTNHPNPKMGEDSVDFDDGWVLGAGVGTSLPVPSPSSMPRSSVWFPTNLRMLESGTLNASSIALIYVQHRSIRKLKMSVNFTSFRSWNQVVATNGLITFPPWSLHSSRAMKPNFEQ
jgi:hypothetical protein